MPPAVHQLVLVELLRQASHIVLHRLAEPSCPALPDRSPFGQAVPEEVFCEKCEECAVCETCPEIPLVRPVEAFAFFTAGSIFTLLFNCSLACFRRHGQEERRQARRGRLVRA